MSIDSENKELRSLTEEKQALLKFTDRRPFIRQLVEAINIDPASKQILFFYGDGGNGKSLLIKYLHRYCCKRLLPETWEKLRNSPDEELINQIVQLSADRYLPVPTAFLDFSQRPVEDEHPQDPYLGLLLLREQLTKQGLHFPRFNFACTWYLHKKGKLTSEKAAALCPTEELMVIDAIINQFSFILPAFGWAGFAGNLLALILKYFGKRFSLNLNRKGVAPELQKEIRDMDVDRELIDALPNLFAQDLNAAFQKKKPLQRVVLFFDTHEAMWGQERQLSDALYFQRDEWLRSLLRALEIEKGIVVVFAGRESPRWSEAPKASIPIAYLHPQDIGYFHNSDAVAYLEKVGITDPELVPHIVRYASISREKVQPLYLGLCADMVRVADLNGKPLQAKDFEVNHQTTNQSRIILNRLLQYVNSEMRDAIASLSACRSFDLDLYLMLGQALHFQATTSGFRTLTNFSFVWQDQQRDQKRYRINTLIQRLDHEMGNELTLKAHQVLEKYHRDQDEVTEAIYHANRQDWERGIQEWLTLFEATLRQGEYQRCRRLLDLQDDLVIQSEKAKGQVSQAIGTYFAELAKHSEAEQAYQDAIANFDASLRTKPAQLDVEHIRGTTYLRWGMLQSNLTQLDQALKSYQQAEKAYTGALAIDRTFFKAINNKALVQAKMGELLANRSDKESAQSAFNDAIATYDRALELNSEARQSHNGKGNVWRNLGKLQQDSPEDAFQYFEDAIACFDDALEIAPKYLVALNNKVLVLQDVGDLQMKGADLEAAMASYEAGLSLIEQVFNRSPDKVAAQNNRAYLLSRMGECQFKQGKHEDALSNYRSGLQGCEQALKLAPKFVEGHETRGTILLGLGTLQVEMSDKEQAKVSFDDAIASFNCVLELAPKKVDALVGKGKTLIEIGDLFARNSIDSVARQSWEEAAKVFDSVLGFEPKYRRYVNLVNERLKAK